MTPSLPQMNVFNAIRFMPLCDINMKFGQTWNENELCLRESVSSTDRVAQLSDIKWD